MSIGTGLRQCLGTPGGKDGPRPLINESESSPRVLHRIQPIPAIEPCRLDPTEQPTSAELEGITLGDDRGINPLEDGGRATAQWPGGLDPTAQPREPCHEQLHDLVGHLG